jgi:hypothetical protein
MPAEQNTSGTAVADFEKEFWGSCANTIGEEIKQLVYARYMGLELTGTWRTSYNFDLKGQRVVDIGGGPVSLLLKCQNGKGTVIDPIQFPPWVFNRYEYAGIEHYTMRGEDLLPLADQYDEAWIYNVLQHVDDPLKIIANARKLARKVRMFEWIDIPPYIGHPHMLTQAMLEAALERGGNTVALNESGCYGRAFYGSWIY